MQRILAILLLGLTLGGCASQQAPQGKLKTVSSTVEGATVTLVHFGAPW